MNFKTSEQIEAFAERMYELGKRCILKIVNEHERWKNFGWFSNRARSRAWVSSQNVRLCPVNISECG